MKERLKTDFHIHASSYRNSREHSGVTVSAVMERCEELSLFRAGIVEHMNFSAKHPPECFARLASDFKKLAPRNGFRLGAELDIMDTEGRLSLYSADVKEKFGIDYFLAAFHGIQDTSSPDLVRRCHRSLISAMKNNAFIDILAHPWKFGRRTTCSWKFKMVPQDCIQELVETAASCGTALEISAKSAVFFSEPEYRSYVLKIISAGAKAALGSDAHSLENIGGTSIVEDFLIEMNFPRELIWCPDE